MSAITPLRPDSDGWESAEAFREGMRQLASGVSIITGGTLEAPVGLVATAVASVSVEPPTLLVSVNRTASAFRTIEASGRLAVNVLGTQHRDLVEAYSRPERRHERFTSGQWIGARGRPPVLSDALASFDCEIVEHLSYFTHTILLGRPVSVRVALGSPLLHFNRGFGGFAMPDRE